MHFSYVRIGSFAEIHLAQSHSPLERRRRVLVRTARGVELGEVVRPHRGETLPANTPIVSTAVVLRATTREDELLIRRLERHKRDAVVACQTALTESGSAAVLLDVDQLFDGGTLVMHFLGAVDEIAESITREVSERYESIVRSRHFAKLLHEGCGPDCGEKQGGCGSGGCAGCAAASVCHSA